jgi:corrinoid protein of di/trimethylamine methyltransferase
VKKLSEEEIFGKLCEAVVACDRDAVVEAAEKAIEKGVDPVKAIEEGLSKGARIIGDKFDKLEIFLPELLIAADAMKAGIDILLAKIPKDKILKKGTVVCGAVKGDIHEIGKKIVAALLRANGFEVYDLGADVPTSKFIEEARKVGADIIGLSALMASTIGAQKDVIDYLKAVGERERYIVMVGGGPTTQEWADEIGADGYAETATEAVKLASELIKRKKGMS